VNPTTSLDVGCGFPNPSEPYQKRGDIGVDIKKGYADILCDAHALPFKPNVFDRVSLHSTLDHLENPVHALREARRVCSHDFIVTVSNADYWAYSFSNPNPEHYSLWNINTLKAILAKVGFHDFT